MHTLSTGPKLRRLGKRTKIRASNLPSTYMSYISRNTIFQSHMQVVSDYITPEAGGYAYHALGSLSCESSENSSLMIEVSIRLFIFDGSSHADIYSEISVSTLGKILHTGLHIVDSTSSEPVTYWYQV